MLLRDVEFNSEILGKISVCQIRGAVVFRGTVLQPPPIGADAV
jgi:hypothetical protein